MQLKLTGTWNGLKLLIKLLGSTWLTDIYKIELEDFGCCLRKLLGYKVFFSLLTIDSCRIVFLKLQI
jgi:hypothetical protein